MCLDFERVLLHETENTRKRAIIYFNKRRNMHEIEILSEVKQKCKDDYYWKEEKSIILDKESLLTLYKFIIANYI